jgi:hypothetical protein
MLPAIVGMADICSASLSRADDNGVVLLRSDHKLGSQMGSPPAITGNWAPTRRPLAATSRLHSLETSNNPNPIATRSSGTAIAISGT